jgi:hypoxia-inducible factor prolyl hydroxylase
VGSLQPKPNIDCQRLEQPASLSPLPFEGSSEIEILNAVAEVLSPDFLDSLEKEFTPELMLQHEMPYLDGSGMMADGNHRPQFLHRNSRELDIIDEVSKTVIKDMDAYGICVVDNFLGLNMGVDVLDEVLDMYRRGLFKDGQLVSTRNANNDIQNIRSDKIAWIDGKESYCRTIGQLISRVDAVIIRANQSMTGSKLGEHIITGRTKVRLKSFIFGCQKKFN